LSFRYSSHIEQTLFRRNIISNIFQCYSKKTERRNVLRKVISNIFQCLSKKDERCHDSNKLFSNKFQYHSKKTERCTKLTRLKYFFLLTRHGRLFNDFFASKLSAFFGFVYHRKLFQCLKAISTHRVLKVKQDLLQK
jgi:hypothetical protein